MPISATLERWQKQGDEHLFKIIVSPEFGNRMDLARHTKELVGQMEKDLRTQLQWVAVEHHNTDDPHVHLAIRGVDDSGKTLQISPEYISHGSRQRAQEGATRQLGYRTDRDVAEALDRQIAQQRFTQLDRMLLKQAKNQEVSFEGVLPSSQKARDQRLRHIRRLAQLETMGLAKKVSAKTWTLSPMLESALRQRQISQDRLKTKFQHRELITDERAPLVASELKAVGQRVAGRLVGTGLNEKTSRPYLMVEGFDGRVHYVNQGFAAQRMRAQGELPIGQFVVLEVVQRQDRRGNQSTGVRVEAFGRTMTPALLDRELLANGQAIESPDQKITVAGAYRAAAAERLTELQSVGAVVVTDGKISVLSHAAHDRLRFRDEGLDGEPHSGGALVGRVVAKGRASLVVEASDGRRVVLDGEKLASMNLPIRYVTTGAALILTPADAGKGSAVALRADQLQDLVSDRRVNKLDLVRKPLADLPAGHALHKAMQARVEVWRSRGVDAMESNFSLKANGWRKSVELHESAAEKGVEKVVEELSISRGKPSRELACESGRQVSGRVLLVSVEQGRAAVVVDAGQELMVLRQPGADTAGLSAGMRVRARAEEITETNGQRRLMTWRFADLEREQALSKGKGRDKF